MGTEITLEVGGLTISYYKNGFGDDHGMLFQESDRKQIRSNQINYDYFDESGEDPSPWEMAFARSLGETAPRLELIGFTINRVRREYESKTEEWLEICRGMADEEAYCIPELMTFPEFCAFVKNFPIDTLDDTYILAYNHETHYGVQGRFRDDMRICRLPFYREHDISAYSERSYFGELLSFLTPYSFLTLLAQNSRNLELELIWQYGPLVENGWARECDFVSGARRIQTFLIATEGSSDALILEHALSILRPDVADFFRFIDMSAGHPFPGTGNLLKFAKGLVRIDVQNNVVFLFDNDAEGAFAYRQLQQLNMPPNMRAMKLPDLDCFKSFRTCGPEGESMSDINGRAAAIECYLDLRLSGRPPASVIWTNYREEENIYHGALEHKTSYMKKFMAQTSASISANGYDVTNIGYALDALIRECKEISQID